MTKEPSYQSETRLASEDVVGVAHLQEKLKGARALLNYALGAKNLHVTDKIIKDINSAAAALPTSLGEHADRIDQAIRDLTKITYPTTMETLKHADVPRRVLKTLVGVAAVVLIGAVVAYHGRPTGEQGFEFGWASSLLGVCLGFLGAIVYVFFNLLGVMRAKAFDPSAYAENATRVFLGGILGWLFYFTYPAALNLPPPDNPLIVLLPFLAGFSTRLVFGVLNQAIKAVELTLGIEDTDSQLRRRDIRPGEPSGTGG